ncbi:MAG: phage portal protein [Candidatus Sphingomonas colombiensis]|nr:phage portal protein [Sphingomonas sp.]WEK44206.1 MAG: phage portal protein [Sphingomonas sp.]
MKLFGWKPGREGSRPALSRGATYFDEAGRWPQGYEAQVRAGYCGNAIAQRAVRLVAESVGGAPIDASTPELARLIGTRMGGERLLGVVAAQLLLHGNAFVQILRDAEGGVAELYPLRPERVSVELDAAGWPAGYAYRVGGLKAAAAREIALAFGVPPMLLGLPGDATYANYKEANRALWRLTVLPLADALLGALVARLERWFPEARLEIDPDRVPALVEDRERLWRMVSAADFITDEEKRQMVGWSQ